jgi:hypothetical protein
MKTLMFAALVAAGALSTAASAQPLNPADRYDVQHEAEWAVQDVTMKTGEPVAAQGGYVVPVTVAGTKCTVLVRPYTPKSDREPPVRWKADPAACGK